MRDPADIARRRDAPITMKLGNEADGKLLEFVTIDDGLYAVAERAIFKMTLADTIDPERAHPHTPHVNQKVASSGADSEVVQRTLLQAARLLSKPYIEEAQSHRALHHVLSALQELLAAEVIVEELKGDLTKAEVDLPNQHDGSMNLPAVGNVDTRSKAFIQRAEHCLQSVFQLTKCFLGEVINEKFFVGFAKHIAAAHPDQAEYVAFAEGLARFGTMIRNTRHCVEHPKDGQQLVLADYHIREGLLHRPEIEVAHRETPHERMPLHEFMELVLANLTSGLESLILFLAANHVRPMGGMGIAVGPDPDFERATPKVRYCYFIAWGSPPAWQKLG